MAESTPEKSLQLQYQGMSNSIIIKRRSGMSENKVAEIMKTDEGKISDMGTLLFTEDELYSNRPYKLSLIHI